VACRYQQPIIALLHYLPLYLRLKAVLPQASVQKSPDSQINSLDQRKLHLIKIFASKFAVSLEMI